MISNYFFLAATLLLSLNFIRPFGLAISDWLYFASLIFAVAETMRTEHQNLICWTKNRFIAPSVLIMFGAIISTTQAMQMDVAIIEIVQQIYAVTVFVSLTWLMVRRGQSEWVVRVFILSGLFTAGVALLDFFTGSRLGPQLSGTPNVQLWYRYAGTLGHPNKFGYFLVLTSILTLAYLGKPKNTLLIKALLVVSFAGQLLAIYISGSVTAYLGILLGILIFFFFSQTFRNTFIKFAIPIIFFGSLTYILITILGIKTPLNSYSVPDNIVTLSLERVQSLTAESRYVVYQQAIGQVERSSFIGVGYDQVSTSNISGQSRYLDYSVHNALLQILYTGGLFAFLGWVIIYIIAGLGAIRILIIPNDQRFTLILGAAASTLATILMDQFSDSIYEREKWLVLGLCMSYIWTKKITAINKTRGMGSLAENPSRNHYGQF
jgi:O-antigen ligase